MSDQLLTLDATRLSNREIHPFLVSAVAPRPIAFASTIDADGNKNLSPFSYFNLFSSNPPILVFSPVRSGRDNTTKDTFNNVKAVPEVCINVVNYPIVEQMSLSSTAYDKGVNEFEKSGLSELPSETIRPPRVKEAPISFECTVDEVKELGNEGGAGSLVICRILRVHIDRKYLNEDGRLDSTKLDLVGRMGESWYCRASGDALFEIPKPVRSKGIGVDRLPESIRKSTVLSANNLGRLGNADELPGEDIIHETRQDAEVMGILENADDVFNTLHLLAKKELENGNADRALSILLIADRHDD